jgi:hypothetical protein
LNAIGWGSGNPKCFLNPYVITFTPYPPSKSRSFTM